MNKQKEKVKYEIDGINMRDYPDFVDAYISAAYKDGEPVSEEELDRLNEDRDLVYRLVIEKIY